MKNICLDCLQIFEQPEIIERPDLTGHMDLHHVCPACIGENIEPIANKHLLIMDDTELKHLSYVDGYFRNAVKENMWLSIDPIIRDHYKSLLHMSEIIFKNIKKLD
jgi:hypothetical protein